MSIVRLSYDVDADDLVQAGDASSQMKMTLKQLGIPHEAVRRAAICMYEGEINMVIHADGGRVEVDVDMETITVRLIDRGPGIPDIEKAMTAGFSTAGEEARDLGFGAGMGLPNMKAYSDDMTIETQIGVGTTVTLVIQI